MGKPKDICATRHRGNPESEIANLRIQNKKLGLRLVIYEKLAASSGLTCEEISEQLGIRYTTVSARLSELRKDGWAVTTGNRRKTTGGSEAAILRAVTTAEREGRNVSQQSLF